MKELSGLQTLSMRVDTKTIEHLKHLARYESFEQDKDITYVDLIRDAISNTYPVPDGDNEND